MTDLTCWICEEHDTCPYPVCAEQETTVRIQHELELEESEEAEMSKPRNGKVLRYVANSKRARKLSKRGEAITWDCNQHCWAWLTEIR